MNAQLTPAAGLSTYAPRIYPDVPISAGEAYAAEQYAPDEYDEQGDMG